MLDYVRKHSVGLASLSFIFGILTSVVHATRFNGTDALLLALGVFVCSIALVITLVARILIWSAKKNMPSSLLSMRWHELTAEQFQSIGFAARISFISQHLGIFAAVFGFGWMAATMLLVTIGRI
jgi:hypothetical protein